MYVEWRVLWAWPWELGTDNIITNDNWCCVDIEYIQSATDNDYRHSWYPEWWTAVLFFIIYHLFVYMGSICYVPLPVEACNKDYLYSRNIATWILVNICLGTGPSLVDHRAITCTNIKLLPMIFRSKSQWNTKRAPNIFQIIWKFHSLFLLRFEYITHNIIFCIPKKHYRLINGLYLLMPCTYSAVYISLDHIRYLMTEISLSLISYILTPE